MFISAKTLDDLLNKVFSKLLKADSDINPTRGAAKELMGVLLEVKSPRARLSRTEKKGKLFSCLGELIWYLSQSDRVKFIEYYIQKYADDSDDGKTIYGAYGQRLFNMQGQNQVANVIEILKHNSDSRRAVIQLFDASDITQRRKAVPCTCTLQFFVRKKYLHMLTNMRSNDAYWGLPHDVFAFTMLQEIIACSLGLEIGTYRHAVGSLHLYEKHFDDAKQFLDEGWQASLHMPPMPKSDPWKAIRKIVKVEKTIRRGNNVNIAALKLDTYWEDMVRLLQIYHHSKTKSKTRIATLRKQMVSKNYDIYIQQKENAAIRKPEQLLLPLTGKNIDH